MCIAGFNGWFEVKKMVNAIPKSDIVITATGNKDIITAEHFLLMKTKRLYVILVILIMKLM